MTSSLSELRGVLVVKLFGSFARNEQHAESDIDLAVVIDDTVDLNTAMVSTRKMVQGLSWPIDLVVIPLSVYNKKREIGGSCFEINIDCIELFPDWIFGNKKLSTFD